MLNIKLICIGKLKEKFYMEAEREYKKRLQGYCRLEIEVISECQRSDHPSAAQRETALMKEAEAIEQKIPKGSIIISMCIEGQTLSSEDLSEIFQKYSLNGDSKLCFVIGGSEGLSERMKEKSHLCLSMSKMTFPHHLARIMLLEQVYRCFKITEGGKYHK